MVCPAEMADVIVIGAGPTGVFSAQILAAGGFSVILVCESSKGPSRHQYHRFSPNIQFDHFSGFGGGTNLWANVCRPHDQQDYVRFSNQKLYPERESFIQASKFLNVDLGSIFWHSKTKPRQHTTWIDMLGDKIELLEYVYPKKITQLNFEKLEEPVHSKLSILSNHFAQTIERFDKGFKVHLVDRLGSKICTVYGRRVMICAGTVGSAALMERSVRSGSLKINPKARSNIGQNIHEHFMFTIGRISFERQISKLRPRKLGNQIVKFAFRLKNYKCANHTIYPLPALSNSSITKSDQLRQILISIQNQTKRNPIAILKLLFHVNLLYQVIDEKILSGGKASHYDLWTVLQSDPSETRRIVFDDYGLNPTLHFRFEESDLTKVKYLQKKLKESLIGGSFVEVDAEDIQNNASIAAHLAGSLRQSTTPTNGVVDENFELFGCKGVYVGDASTIPVSGTSNITLTACANSWKASVNLVKDLKNENLNYF